MKRSLEYFVPIPDYARSEKQIRQMKSFHAHSIRTLTKKNEDIKPYLPIYAANKAYFVTNFDQASCEM